MWGGRLGRQSKWANQVSARFENRADGGGMSEKFSTLDAELKLWTPLSRVQTPPRVQNKNSRVSLHLQ